MSTLDLVVTGVARETELIRRVTLARPDGGPLPGYTAGAHLTIQVPGVGVRKYSLVNADAAPGATAAPRAYTLGVRLEAASEGGSRYIHSLKVGDKVAAEAPANAFALTPAGEVVLIGGGIGITPMISMAAELKAAGRPFRLIYAMRARDEMAFRDEIHALTDGAVHVHADAEAGSFFDMNAALAQVPEGATVFVCGPKPMIKAGMDGARALKWPRDRLRFELFFSVKAPEPPKPAPVDDGSFEVVLQSAGKTLKVPKDKTILDVLLDAGLDPLHDCKRGECGVCQVAVIEGVPDHKDVILSESERAANKVIQICISRSKSPKLVLDL
jgi:vanillate O-demethylase ferredoxin subunit